MLSLFIGILICLIIVFISLSLDDIVNWLDKKRIVKRNKKLLADVSTMNVCGKQMPKFINKLNEGDKIFVFYMDSFKKELRENILNNVSIVDSLAPYELRCFTVKNATLTYYKCIDEIDCYETEIFKPSKDVFVTEYKSYKWSGMISSASLEMLLIYLKKMEKDTRLSAIERMKTNEKRCNEDDVNKWLDSLKNTNLKVN